MNRERALGSFKVGIFAVMGVGLAWSATNQPEVAPVAPVVPPAASPEAVMAEHEGECWTGEAPKGILIPGAVVWQHPDGITEYSVALVGPALDTLFADGTLPGRPIAFCA